MNKFRTGYSIELDTDDNRRADICAYKIPGTGYWQLSCDGNDIGNSALRLEDINESVRCMYGYNQDFWKLQHNPNDDDIGMFDFE